MKTLNQIEKNDNFYIEYDTEEGFDSLYATKTKKHLGSFDCMQEGKFQFYDNGVLIYKKEYYRLECFITVTFYNNAAKEVFFIDNISKEGETTWDDIQFSIYEKGIQTITTANNKLYEEKYTEFSGQEEIKEQ